MIRSFGVALITIVVVVLFGLHTDVAAVQQGNAAGAGQVPFQFTGGTPGVNLELFLNAGKVADVSIGTTGTGSSILDLSNLGKVQLQVYVDVCQDGKTIRVLVVAGQPPPEDNCKRRVVGAGWSSDCGVTRLTLDLTKFGMRVIGCGAFYTQPKYIIPIAGGLGLIPILGGGGGGDSNSTFVSTPIIPATTPVNTTVTNLPPVTPPTTTPTPPPVTASGNYVCMQCAIKLDISRHDPTLRVCNGLTAIFTVIQGSLTIRHQSPFIEVSGASYNTTSGEFDISGTGSIAGFNGVAARAVGSVNNQTGRITFDYTLGSNGVFPGGQPITYSVTLQKQ